MTNATPPVSPTLVLGLGHRFRRDDSIGLVLADWLKATAPADTRVETLEGAFPALWERWISDERILLLDAACDGAPPGTLRVYDLRDAPPPVDGSRTSSHGFGLVEAVELAKELRALPRGLALLTVCGEDFSVGPGLSASVKAALPAAQDRILAILRSSKRPPC